MQLLELMAMYVPDRPVTSGQLNAGELRYPFLFMLIDVGAKVKVILEPEIKDAVRERRSSSPWR